MKIITISREVGSGGRELGKRLADALNFDYYDREIIEEIAKNKGLDENYVASELENNDWQHAPLHFRCSFLGVSSLASAHVDLLLEQRKVIEAIAERGRDFVIVGRNSDIILKKYGSLNIFVCATMESKIKRCMARAREDEKLTEKQAERQIKSIDKNRALTHEIVAEGGWGNRTSYHLTINTSDREIKEIVPSVAAFASEWFNHAK